MSTGIPFMVGPPEDRARPWRVLADGEDSNGMALGDGCILPGEPGPGRHVHTREDEGIYVVAGVLTWRSEMSGTRSGPYGFLGTCHTRLRTLAPMKSGLSDC